MSRRTFDRLVAEAVASLPADFRAALEEMPVRVLDRPEPGLLREMGMAEDELLLGLHVGVPLTERSVEDAPLPSVIHLYVEDHEDACDSLEELREQVRVTLLHEVGHHFGLDEDDLERLGYD